MVKVYRLLKKEGCLANCRSFVDQREAEDGPRLRWFRLEPRVQCLLHPHATRPENDKRQKLKFARMQREWPESCRIQLRMLRFSPCTL
jgi:hypothetical protein